jgi:hypothetical protein
VTVDANFWEVLMLPYRHKADAIAQAGLSDVVQKVQERRQTAIERAAKDLEELRISPVLLAQWVDTHLMAVASGKPSFPMGQAVVVESKTGQVRLFAEK